MEHKMKPLDSSTTTATVQWNLPVSPQKCCQCIDGEWLRAEKNWCQDKTESSCSVCAILISTLSAIYPGNWDSDTNTHRCLFSLFFPWARVAPAPAESVSLHFTSRIQRGSLAPSAPLELLPPDSPSPQLYSKQDPKKVISPTFCFCNQSGWLQDSRRPLQHEDREETLLVTIITTIHIVKQLCQYLSDMQDTRISKDVLHKLNQLGAMFRDVPYGLMVPSCGELGRQDGRQAESQASPSCPVFMLSLDLLRLRLRERFRRREVLRARFSGLRSRLVVSSASNSARPVPACLHTCLSHESKFPNC